MYLGVHGTPESKQRYQEIVKKHPADHAKVEMAQSVVDHVDITVAEIVVRYLVHVDEYYVKDGRPTSQASLIRLAANGLLDRFSHLEAREFGPLALARCQAAFVEQGICRKEVNRRVHLIRQCFKWAVSQELIPVSVYEALRTLQGLRRGRTTAPDRPWVRPVPDANVRAILPFLPRAVRAMVEIQWLTGMRPTEVAIMRTMDLNMSGTIWEYKPASHKLEHLEVERVIMIGPRAQAVLKPWLRTDLETYLFSPATTLEECQAERTENRKTPRPKKAKKRRRTRNRKRPLRDLYDVTGYRRAIHRACDAAFPHPELSTIEDELLTEAQRSELASWRKQQRWSPNRLRHATATLVRREMGIDAARALLGHSDADTTTFYAERDKELARVAMQKLG